MRRMLALCPVVLLGSGAAAQPTTDLREMIHEVQAHERILLEKLKDERTWMAAKRERLLGRPLWEKGDRGWQDEVWKSTTAEAKLLRYLFAAKHIRAPSLAPVLAEHIAYSPYHETQLGGLALHESKFPAYGALQAIGTPAVQSMLDRLKKLDPDRWDTQRLDHILLVYCLVDIYGQGGHGATLARKRLEIEAGRSTGMAKQRLLRALKHPIITGKRVDP